MRAIHISSTSAVLFHQCVLMEWQSLFDVTVQFSDPFCVIASAGSRAGFNVLTAVIDGGTVYGGTDEAARSVPHTPRFYDRQINRNVDMSFYMSEKNIRKRFIDLMRLTWERFALFIVWALTRAPLGGGLFRAPPLVFLRYLLNQCRYHHQTCSTLSPNNFTHCVKILKSRVL